MSAEKNDFFRKIFRLLDLLLIVMIVAVFAEVLVEVFFRYVLHQPLSWGGELSQTILVWITFIGAAAALFRGEHMTIDLLVVRISSPKVKKAFQLLVLLIMGAFIVAGIDAGWTVVVRTWRMRTTAMQIPAGILYLAFPAGCLLMLPVIVRDFFRTIRG
jgi:TRAP-type C4-dicarboxylate transport system permease small subunit